jgi:hypothetical protein
MIRMRGTDDAASPKPLPSSNFSRRSSSRSQRHICARCGKPRSSRYHESHLLVPGQIPESDICARPDCARFKRALLEGHCPQAQIFEVHHYYHRSSDAKPPTHATELPGESPLAGRAEAIGNLRSDAFQQTFRSGRPSPMNPPAYQTHTAELPGEGSLAGRAEKVGDLPREPFQRPFRSGRPSPMNPPAYPTHAARLQGEGSLAGRGQLQYSAIRPKYRSGRLSPIGEESPPKVNYLTKPTLRFPGDG